ncbi:MULTISPECIES: DNA/RNA non-specific endonuclease [unclassified Leptolyngbya]|uniref:DNA/RNA non-specific endonuclease n=1 Tax=unclassified Leptolyngbya TaxID=2650499 RepID=UPI0016838405|nr:MULTISPECIES: DNA/RNA non-specific endonuclease [unclassified Leptolyngbya]MBD1911379.1 DNA/RNA non-specific endonuclease [Leptolyngbya sp. FACHB-8]MBD2156603.1 DNA/RNA non-specific endonuclease [Leptolyngbya sp. FACHB-16]
MGIWRSHQNSTSHSRWAWLIALPLLLSGCTLFAPSAQRVENVNLLLGNPSGAIADPDSANNYLIVRPQYVLSYGRDRAIANWASWQLTRSWLGNGERPPFQADRSLPEGWYVVTPNDYSGSGFDRGHLVPAADRNRSPEDSAAVFLMTNIVPQARDNNQGPWNALETYCRQLVNQGKELYIIAGASGIGGVGERGPRTTIGRGRVTVPEVVWKIIVVLDQPITSAEEIGAGDRVIAVILPNVEDIRENDWRQYRQSVDQIERLTGYDFLSTLRDDVEESLEAQTDVQR